MTSDAAPELTRRTWLAATGALCAGTLWPRSSWAKIPTGGRLRFAIFRGDSHVGEQVMSFTGGEGSLGVSTRMSVVVRLGPIPVYRYSHEAEETWRDGVFARLQTRTSSNGRREQVTAEGGAGEVRIEATGGRWTAPLSACPLTHWNPAVLKGPLFNPQTGRLLRLKASRSASPPPSPMPEAAACWRLRGETEIDDWYDRDGAWLALRGRLSDRSTMIYRRL